MLLDVHQEILTHILAFMTYKDVVRIISCHSKARKRIRSAVREIIVDDEGVELRSLEKLFPIVDRVTHKCHGGRAVTSYDAGFLKRR